MLFTEKTTKAMSFANYAHADQKDKSGAPYMLHVYRVADAMDTEDETCATLFHDILEDCSFDIRMDFRRLLVEEYPAAVQGAVLSLTRNEAEPYEAYIQRLKPDAIAKKVKIADLLEHLSLDRAEYLTPSMEKRYRAALKALLEEDVEDRCAKCRKFIPSDSMAEMVCAVKDSSFDCKGQGCESFDPRYIQYPITVTSIKTAKDVPLPSLYPCGQPVSVRPCGDKETYFGILLGEMPYTSHVSFDRKNGELTVGHMLNSAIYVPKLGRVVYGFESWWQRIDTDEEADKAITDDGIQNQWYMRMLRDAMRGE